jgi:hypothetical protein
MSIEVFDGPFAASSWREAFGDNLVETAVSTGATDWNWQKTAWGIVFEVAFNDEADWERFRQTLIVQIALDAVPDPVGGLLVYRGRGGSSGSPNRRKPRPFAGAGAAALPIPVENEEWRNFSREVEQRRKVLVGAPA